MNTLIFNNQKLVLFSVASDFLGISRQRLHQLCDIYQIEKVYINKKCAAISLKDFEAINKLSRPTGRPSLSVA